MEKLTVAVLTYKRPEQLRRGLPLVIEHVCSVRASNVSAELLVVDNDPFGSAETVVADIASEKIRYVLEEHPGISAGRNRAIDETDDADLLVFIDDDEHPQADWLTPLIETWRHTGAAAVAGRVVSEFEGELDPWIAAGRFFQRRRTTTGTEIPVAASNNLLLDMAQVRQCNVRFDNRLGLSGGEDTLFSRTLAVRGARLVWCDESIVTDAVPAARMSRRWVLTRACSHGNSTALVELHLTAGTGRQKYARAIYVAKGLLRVVAGAARYLLGILGRSHQHQARGLRTLCRGIGFVSGALGISYQEYGRSKSPWQRLNPLSTPEHSAGS